MKKGLKTNKRGRLTNVEKYTIQGMYKSNQSIDDIVLIMERSESTIKKYIKEMQVIDQTVQNVRDQAKQKLELKKEKEENQDKTKSEEFTKEAQRKKEVQDQNRGSEYDQLTDLQKAGFISKAAGGREGVTVATRAASEIGDEQLKNKKEPRTGRGNIYLIREKKVV